MEVTLKEGILYKNAVNAIVSILVLMEVTLKGL